MPDYRHFKKIQDRGDVDFPRRPGFHRTRRRLAMGACALLGLWPLVWQWSSEDQTIYWSHPVSEPHQLIGSDCRKCHSSALQSVGMLFRSPEKVRGIEAKTCQTCHTEHALDHHPQTMIANEARSCFECHQEHRAEGDLLAVPDHYCIACHEDLRCQDGEMEVASRSFIREIHSFDEHPEFALRRTSQEESLTRLYELQADEPGRASSSHHALQVAKLSESPAGDSSGYAWEDRARFNFNHAKHLTKGGLPIGRNHPLNKNRALGESLQPKLELTCQSCHQTEADGRYMKPITFDEHCKSCHELYTVNTEIHPHPGPRLPQDDLPVTKNVLAEWETLPHVEFAIIKGILRDRLTAYIKQHPDELKPKKKDPGLSLNADNPKEDDAIPKQEADWVEARLGELQSPKLRGDALREFPSIHRVCARCHHFEQDTTAGPAAWKVLRPEIPRRWYPHSRFSHARHELEPLLSCTDCHYKAPPTEDDPFRDPHSIYYSNSARDVLLPSIAVCRRCHGEGGKSAFGGKARSDCVECHSYHHQPSVP